MNYSKFFTDVKNVVKKHSPEILTGIGIAGMITGTIMAVKATPKALLLIAERKTNDEVEVLTTIETVKTTWKCYVPATIVSLASVGCLIGASSVNYKRNAAIATAYTISETALKDYQRKVIETIGEKKEQVVQDAVAKDKIDKDPICNKEIIITNSGEQLCYDCISGRYFKADVEHIKSAVNDLNMDMLDETFISLNDFYYAIGLSNIPLGDELGWDIKNGYIKLRFSSQLTENQTPCLVINYVLAPDYH